MSKNSTIVIPYGWQRHINTSSSPPVSSITYVSPSGVVLSSIPEVCQYLEKDDTCKCGLRCPIHVPKVFSFNPEVQSVDLTEKEWNRRENKTESHRKNCQHWNKLQKTQIGKKKASCHPELNMEPSPKLIIIRKDGQLRSMIPDSRSSAGKKGTEDMKKEVKSSVAGPLPTKKSSAISPLKSPLFETGVKAVRENQIQAIKSKNDFKLQWIKADDDPSQNDVESENEELCFSPDPKKSPPMSLPHALISGLGSPPSALFKQENQLGMGSRMNPPAGPVFMQGNIPSTRVSAFHAGVEPVHRFGMSAFPGSNFMVKNDPGFGHPNPIQRYPALPVKSEHGTQLNQPSPFNMVPNMGLNRRGGFAGTQDLSGINWQQNQNSFMGGNQRHLLPKSSVNPGNFSAMTTRAQMPPLKSPTRQTAPQRFPMGSPTMLNPTSPYLFQMANIGQPTVPLASPGATDPSPFSTRSQSRSSSVGTPAPSPGGPWQGGRSVHIADSSRPLSRSSNATTPGPEASPANLSQWNIGNTNAGMLPARVPGAAPGFAPDQSPGSTSPFSPPRYPQVSPMARFSQDANKRPQLDMSPYANPQHLTASQQLRMHSQSYQQHNQQCENPSAMQFQSPPSPFSPNSQFVGNMNFQGNQQQLSQNMDKKIFRPCPPYRPAKIQFARINEPDPNLQLRFPFRPTQPQMHHPVNQNPRFMLNPQQQQWHPFSGATANIGPGQHHPSGILPPGIPNPVEQVPRVPPPKPKRTRKRKASKANSTKVQQRMLLQPSINSADFISTEFPDFLHSVQPPNNAGILTTHSAVISPPNTTDFGFHSSKHQTQVPVLPTSSAQSQLPAPNLVMPISQAATEKQSLSPLKPPEAVTVSTSVEKTKHLPQPLPLPVFSSSLHKDSSRGVTTPPLPLLSPGSLFEEPAPVDDDDDFSNFASPNPAVFEFPVAKVATLPNQLQAISSTGSSLEATTLQPTSYCSTASVIASSTLIMASVNTSMAVATPVVTTVIKQSVSTAVSVTLLHNNLENKSETTTKSNILPGTCAVKHREPSYRGHWPDVTCLVSSTGKVFHVPLNSREKTNRRFSDQIHHKTKRQSQEARKRYMSDPNPQTATKPSQTVVLRPKSTTNFDIIEVVKNSKKLSDIAVASSTCTNPPVTVTTASVKVGEVNELNNTQNILSTSGKPILETPLQTETDSEIGLEKDAKPPASPKPVTPQPTHLENAETDLTQMEERPTRTSTTPITPAHVKVSVNTDSSIMHRMEEQKTPTLPDQIGSGSIMASECELAVGSDDNAGQAITVTEIPLKPESGLSSSVEQMDTLETENLRKPDASSVEGSLQSEESSPCIALNSAPSEDCGMQFATAETTEVKSTESVLDNSSSSEVDTVKCVASGEESIVVTKLTSTDSPSSEDCPELSETVQPTLSPDNKEADSLEKSGESSGFVVERQKAEVPIFHSEVDPTDVINHKTQADSGEPDIPPDTADGSGASSDKEANNSKNNDTATKIEDVNASKNDSTSENDDSPEDLDNNRASSSNENDAVSTKTGVSHITEDSFPDSPTDDINKNSVTSSQELVDAEKEADSVSNDAIAGNVCHDAIVDTVDSNVIHEGIETEGSTSEEKMEIDCEEAKDCNQSVSSNLSSPVVTLQDSGNAEKPTAPHKDTFALVNDSANSEAADAPTAVPALSVEGHKKPDSNGTSCDEKVAPSVVHDCKGDLNEPENMRTEDARTDEDGGDNSDKQSMHNDEANVFQSSEVLSESKDVDPMEEKPSCVIREAVEMPLDTHSVSIIKVQETYADNQNSTSENSTKIAQLKTDSTKEVPECQLESRTVNVAVPSEADNKNSSLCAISEKTSLLQENDDNSKYIATTKTDLDNSSVSKPSEPDEKQSTELTIAVEVEDTSFVINKVSSNSDGLECNAETDVESSSNVTSKDEISEPSDGTQPVLYGETALEDIREPLPENSVTETKEEANATENDGNITKSGDSDSVEPPTFADVSNQKLSCEESEENIAQTESIKDNSQGRTVQNTPSKETTVIKTEPEDKETETRPDSHSTIESSGLQQSLPHGLASSSTALNISPELTTTVIRQLSNYNMILKNLLARQVTPADLAQLTSTSSAQDEQQTKMISAIIAGRVPIDRLLTESGGSSELVRTTAGEQLSSVNQASSASVTQAAISHGDASRESDRSNMSSKKTTIVSSEPALTDQDPSTPPAKHASSRPDSSQMESDVAQLPSPAKPKASNNTHQGLQVPIVSSSVKGTSSGDTEEEDPEGMIKVKDKPMVQDEVSTSVKAPVNVTPPVNPPHVIAAEVRTTPEKRRGRSRNASRQGTKRHATTESTNERASKRPSGTTSSSGSVRAGQRGSGDRHTRNVKSGDLVWGQMRGFPSWPGKVVKPSEVRGLQQRAPLSEGKVWVKWFGDHTFTQMNPADLVTMTEGLEAHHRSRKKGRTRTRKISIHLEKAIQEAVDELEQQQGSLKISASSLLPSTSSIELPSVAQEQVEKSRRGRKRKTT